MAAFLFHQTKRILPPMINSAHVIIYTKNAEKTRAFFRDILKFPNVDAGHGWLIFALPPTELGIHPTDKLSDEKHELFLMCGDLKKTVADLKKKKVKCGPVREPGFGFMTSVEIPGGGTLGLYQPKHPTALKLKPRK